MNLAENIDAVISRVERARLRVSPHHIVKIVAVTKYVDSAVIEELYKLGQRAFGENRVQELEKKSAELIDLPLEWHFIGRIQKNKINKLLSLNPFLIQSIDSVEIAGEFAKRIPENRKIRALLQINSSGEVQKAGVAPEAAYDIYKEISEKFPNIELKGVMTIGAHTEDVNEIRKSFRKTFRIYEKLKKEGATICSMGMSNDFEIAISEGANLVRLGSILVK